MCLVRIAERCTIKAACSKNNTRIFGVGVEGREGDRACAKICNNIQNFYDKNLFCMLYPPTNKGADTD